MKTFIVLIVITVVIYGSILVYSTYDAYVKYEKCRSDNGSPYVKLIDTGTVEMMDWIAEFDKLDERATYVRYSFDQNEYHKDALQLLGETIDVSKLIDIYTWQMPEFQILNSVENLNNLNQMIFRIKYGLIGDAIERGIDSDGNIVARLSLNGKVIVLWQQDGVHSYEYAIAPKK